VSDRRRSTLLPICHRLFWTLAVLTVLGFPRASADQSGFDDPVATLSENDNLEEMIRGGYRFDNIELVVHRATMGAIKTDKAYARRKQQMQKLKMLWGAFMFVRAEDPDHVQNASAQAMHFLSEISKYKADVHDRVVLSVNWFRYPNGKTYAPPKLTADICQIIHEKTGTWPLVFVDIDLLNELLDGGTDDDGEYIPPQFNAEITALLSNCPLWLSFIETEQKFPPQLLPNSPWKDWVFCFYSSADFPKYAKRLPDGSVELVDLSYFKHRRGDELESWYSAHSWDYVKRGR
jgi:hypothetical protein